MPKSQPDFRSEKSETSEGAGEARARWEAYIDSVDPSVLQAAFGSREDALGPRWAKETSELVGFWVAWHIAGGFEALEWAGWNRATIFRKVRRFRAVFGAHPDEYSFSFIGLDPHRYWNLLIAHTLLLDDFDEAAEYDWTRSRTPTSLTEDR